jgi:hypothetical protein
MATIQGTIGNARRKLAYPKENSPSDMTLGEYAYEVIDSLTVEANQSRGDWFSPRFTVSVQDQVAEYPLPAIADFGKAHFVFTADPSDPLHRPRPVPVVMETDLIQNYAGSYAAMGKHSAEACAFYFKDDQWYVRFAGIPREACDYTVIYEPSTVAGQGLTNQAFPFAQWDDLISDMIALKAVVHAEWDGFDRKENMDRRLELRGSIGEEVATGALRFRKWKRSQFQGNQIRSQPWGHSRRGRY